MVEIPDDYYSTIADLESSNNPNAYNAGSHATGLYQFEPATWNSLGMGSASMYDPDAQQEAIQKLTTQNASYLQGKGIGVSDTSLYAAHVLGAGSASKILTADPSTSLASIIGNKAASLNKWLGGTAGSAVSAIAGKVSAAGNGIADAANSATASAGAAISGTGGGILALIQSWLDESGFFVRLALGVFAIIVLVAAFAMLKPVQEAAGTALKSAA